MCIRDRLLGNAPSDRLVVGDARDEGLVTGIANNKSIAWGIAQQLHAAGAELGVTYLPDDKGRFEGKVRELTAPLAPTLFEPLNVQDPAQIEAVFAKVKEQWGQIDVLVHCLAFAGKDELIGDYSNISPEGFARALEVSAYSLAPLCKHAKPLFSEGGSVITLSYLGACLLYTSPSPRDATLSRMPSSA